MFKLESTNNNLYHVNRNININRRKLMHRAKVKSLRISVVIVAAFVLWWTPYYTMMIILMFLNPDKRVSIFLLTLLEFFKLSFCKISSKHLKSISSILEISQRSSMFTAQRGITKRNILLWYEQQFGESFDIRCISSLATKKASEFLSQVN